MEVKVGFFRMDGVVVGSGRIAVVGLLSVTVLSALLLNCASCRKKKKTRPCVAKGEEPQKWMTEPPPTGGRGKRNRHMSEPVDLDPADPSYDTLHGINDSPSPEKEEKKKKKASEKEASSAGGDYGASDTYDVLPVLSQQSKRSTPRLTLEEELRSDPSEEVEKNAEAGRPSSASVRTPSTPDLRTPSTPESKRSDIPVVANSEQLNLSEEKSSGGEKGPVVQPIHRTSSAVSPNHSPPTAL